MSILWFKTLQPANLTFSQLNNLIVERDLVDYTVDAMKGIQQRVGPLIQTEERTFEGYALEALVGKQLEQANIPYSHNVELSDHWYDIRFPGGLYCDVKKHSSLEHNSKWLSILDRDVEAGGKLFHLRNFGTLKKLFILFMNVTYTKIEDNADDVICHIRPGWVVRAESFFDCLTDSDKTPNTKYFNHNRSISDVDFIRFNF